MMQKVLETIIAYKEELKAAVGIKRLKA